MFKNSYVGNILQWSLWSLCPEMCSAAATALRKRTRACDGYSTWDPNFLGCTGITRSEEEPCYGKIPCKGKSFIQKHFFYTWD